MVDIPELIKKTAKRLRDDRKTVRHAFQPHPRNVQLLTSQEQAEKFLALTPSEIQALRLRWGDEEVARYIRAQIRNLQV